MENVLYSFKRENKSHHYESVLLKISFHIFISQIIDERIEQGIDQHVQHSHNNILVTGVTGWEEKLQYNNCSIVQAGHWEVRATVGQDFADALGGGDLKDACLYVPVNDWEAYKWQGKDHHSHSVDEQLIDCGIWNEQLT